MEPPAVLSATQKFLTNKAWADSFEREVCAVLRALSDDLVKVLVAPLDIDTQEATDYVVTVPSGNVSCRIRREKWVGWRRDLTLRFQSRSGAKTEVEKLREETVRWYLYAWAEDAAIVDWMFIDLAKVRQARLIESALNDEQIVRLPDGSSFIWIAADDLFYAGAIVRATFGSPGMASKWGASK
jgi:hypothetical protein